MTDMEKLVTNCIAVAVAIAAVAGIASEAVAAQATSAACVGGRGCYPTLAAAIAAAHDGDSVRINPGTYAGGVEIDKSVTLRGAGAGRTIIAGGGPVLTIGDWNAATAPTVVISGVTITGGRTTAIPVDQEGQPIDGLEAFGGGIQIPPTAAGGPGATVTISNSDITGNQATATATYAPDSLEDSPGWPACPGLVPCAFAQSAGGGIASWGALTLIDSLVSGNEAAGVASDADGGGIATFAGSLTLTGTAISRNTAKAVAPNGRYAEGGGLYIGDGTMLAIHASTISGNAAVLTSAFPYFVGGDQTLDMNANGGGVHLGDDVTATVDGTGIDRNSISIVDPMGEPVGFDPGLCLCTDDQTSSTLTMRNSTVSYNRIDVTVASQADVFPGSGSALELDGPGTVTNTAVIGNSVIVRALTGDAVATNGVAVADGSTQVAISNSVIAGNTTSAIAPHGAAEILGGGLMNQGPLLLQSDLITRNQATVSGQSGHAQGGGIFNGPTWFDAGPLTLLNTIVSRNVLAGGPGSVLEGAGIYTLAPATTTIQGGSVSHNVPDDCAGDASC
jgi:hypothetical protein